MTAGLTRDELTEVLYALLPAVTEARRRVAEAEAVPPTIRDLSWQICLSLRVSALEKLTNQLVAAHPRPPKAGP